MRRLAPLLLLLTAACGLESQDETSATLGRWLKVEAVMHHQSRAGCAAAMARLEEDGLAKELPWVTSADAAIAAIEGGQALALQVEDRTPNEMSSILMSLELARGIGLLEPFTAGTDCMADAVVVLTDRLLHAPGALMIYDAGAGIVVLADPIIRRAIYLRVKR